MSNDTCVKKNMRPVIKYNQIVVVCTYKCNIECAHCCLDCTTSEKDIINTEDLDKFIGDPNIHGVNSVELCGGETFLVIKEMLPLVKKLSDQGVFTSIVTNGLWGKNADRAESYIKMLKENGIKKVAVSYDKHHSEAGASIDNVKTIASLCTEHGIEVRVRVVLTLEESIENDTIIHALSLKGMQSLIDTVIISPYGRAKSFSFQQSSIDSFVGCCSLGTLTVLPNGDVRPCCGGPLRDIYSIDNGEWLKLGNINNDTLEKVLMNANSNFFYILLSIGSPGVLKQLAKEYGFTLNFPKELPHLCDFCLWVASHSDKFEEFIRRLEQDKEKIVKRLYGYQECMSKWGLTRNRSAAIEKI